MTAVCAISGCGGEAVERYKLGSFRVLACGGCGMLFRDPMPDEAELRAMYEDPDYHASAYFEPTAPTSDRAFSADEARSGRPQPLGPEARMQELALDWLAAHGGAPTVEEPRLLDIGCGAGGFLLRARARGWQVAGVEYSRKLAGLCRDEHRLDVVCGDFCGPEAPSRRAEGRGYDAVTMWDLLEHVRDPLLALRRAKALLEPSGHLVILTIDSSSLFNRLGHLLYAASGGRARKAVELLYDARHNFFFDRHTLAPLIARAGFEVVDTQWHRAHLARWLSRPVSSPVRAAAAIVDLVSAAARRCYRQLLFCRRTGENDRPGERSQGGSP